MFSESIKFLDDDGNFVFISRDFLISAVVPSTETLGCSEIHEKGAGFIEVKASVERLIKELGL